MRVTHDNEEMEHSDEAASIHFEIHDGMTHVHYTNAHGELMTFFIDHDLSEESEIISAIMEETGLDQVTVEKLVDFTDVIEWDE